MFQLSNGVLDFENGPVVKLGGEFYSRAFFAQKVATFFRGGLTRKFVTSPFYIFEQNELPNWFQDTFSYSKIFGSTKSIFDRADLPNIDSQSLGEVALKLIN